MLITMLKFYINKINTLKFNYLKINYSLLFLFKFIKENMHFIYFLLIQFIILNINPKLY